MSFLIRPFGLAVTACACLLGGVAQAASPDPSGALSLQQALAAAVEAHPDLARYPLDRRIAEAQAIQARLRPRPELGVEFENFAGTGAHNGVDELETTLRLGFVLEHSAKRDARIAVARDGIVRIDADFELMRLDVMSQTTRRFIDVVESQQQLALAERGVELAEQLAASARRRVNAGAASELEAYRASIALERAKLEVEHYEHLLDTQRRWLASQWGASTAHFDSAEADLLALPPVAAFDALEQRLRRSPDFARFDLERKLRESELALARARSSADPVVGAGVRRFEISDDQALIATLQFPLSLGNRNQGEIAAAQARRESVDVQRDAELILTTAALYDLYQELKHARTLVEAVHDTLLPEARKAMQLTRRGYDLGRYSQLELIDAQKTAVELERELLTNAADYHRILAAIERMTALAPASAP